MTTTAKPTNRNEKVRSEFTQHLDRWSRDHLIAEGWNMAFDISRGCWMTTFRVTGVNKSYTLTEAEFEMYRLGFNDRRTAVMHRAPRRAPSGKGSSSGNRDG